MSVITDGQVLRVKYAGQKLVNREGEQIWWDFNGPILTNPYKKMCGRTKCFLRETSTGGFAAQVNNTTNRQTTKECKRVDGLCLRSDAGIPSINRNVTTDIFEGNGTKESPLLYTATYLNPRIRSQQRSSKYFGEKILELKSLITEPKFHEYDFNMNMTIVRTNSKTLVPFAGTVYGFRNPTIVHIFGKRITKNDFSNFSSVPGVDGVQTSYSEYDLEDFGRGDAVGNRQYYKEMYSFTISGKWDAGAMDALIGVPTSTEYAKVSAEFSLFV